MNDDRHAAASFERIFDMQGFDKVARWQMVPLGGVRYVALRSGKGLTVTSTTPAVHVEEIPRSEVPAGRSASINGADRIFLITGRTGGPATLEAKSASGGVLKARLQVDVKSKKSLLASFTFVSDTGGHTSLRNSLSAASWVNGINDVFGGQANIFLTLLRTRTITIPMDLGVKFIWPPDRTPRQQVLYDLFVSREDPHADVNFYLVWNFGLEGEGGDTEGACSGRVIFIEDKVHDTALTMAHELGHYLGAEHHGGARDVHHLMHPYSTGRHIPKDVINDFHSAIQGYRR